MFLRSAAEANFVKIGGDFSKTILFERRGKPIKGQGREVAPDNRSLERKIGWSALDSDAGSPRGRGVREAADHIPRLSLALKANA